MRWSFVISVPTLYPSPVSRLVSRTGQQVGEVCIYAPNIGVTVVSVTGRIVKVLVAAEFFAIHTLQKQQEELNTL